jgi:hypothetical protein
MPIVLRSGGFTIGIYVREHDPPHVHVCYAGAEAIIEIESGFVRVVKGMKKPDVARALKLVQAHRGELLASWIEKRSAAERSSGEPRG